MSFEEEAYKNLGFSKTKKSVFMKPPNEECLKKAFNLIDSNTGISIGSRFLQKHLDRNGIKELGNNLQKNSRAKNFINSFFEDDDNITWKNIHRIDNQNIVLN
jgi:hypothetical protein